MYLDNKYTHWYFKIIKHAKLRDTTEYTEKHHIIPRSLGGDESNDNLVRLTAREHFICHRLLTKMVIGQAKYKMIEAVAIFSNNTNRNLYLNSRSVALIRMANAKASSKRNLGNQYYKNRKPDSPELLRLRSTNAANSRWVNNGDEERFAKNHADLVDRGYVYGRLPFTDTTRKNMGAASKAAITDAHRAAVSERFKGVPKSELTKERMRKPKPNKQNYQGKSWYHSVEFGLETCVKTQPGWPDVKKGRLPKPPREN